MCGSMVDIQSPTAEIRRGKKEEEETAGQKYNGLPYSIGRPRPAIKRYVKTTAIPEVWRHDCVHLSSLWTRFPDAFQHLVPNDNFHCQTPLKRQIWLIWQWRMPVGKSGCEYRLANCGSPTGYDMHFPAILSNYNDMTAYICRRFIPTTAFLVN